MHPLYWLDKMKPPILELRPDYLPKYSLQCN